MAYDPTDEDLMYLAQLDQQFPAANDDELLVTPNIPQITDAPPPAEPIAEDQPDPDVERAENEQQAPPPPAAVPAAPAPQPRELASTQGDQAKLVSKAPAWYESFEPPPKITGAEKAVPAMLGGLLKSFGSFASGANGNARQRNDAMAQGMGDIFGGLGAAGAARASAPQDDYQNRLNAAGKQAQMVATLRSGSGGGLEGERLNLEIAKFQRLLGQDATKAATEKALNTIDSPETKALQDALIVNGTYKPEQARRLTGKQIMFSRVGAQQAAGSERTAANQLKSSNRRYDQWVEKFQMANTEHDRREALDQLNKIAGEERGEERLNAQAEIPGWKFAGKGRPNPPAIEAARKIADATERIQSDAEALNELKKQVSARARVTPNWLQGMLSDEDRALIDEMHSAVFDLRRANAQLGEMGAPQAFEEVMLEKLTPDATGLQSFMNDGTAWAAQGRTAHRLARARMKAYKFVPDSDDEAPPAAATGGQSFGQKLHTAGEATKANVKEGVAAGKQALEGAAQTAQEVAPAAQEAARMIKIQVLDPATKQWGAARDVTVDQYRAAMKKLAAKGLSPDSIRKAQE